MTTTVRRQWRLANAPTKPAYPSAARKAGDSETLDKCYEETVEFFQHEVMAACAKVGMLPDGRPSNEFLAMMVGRSMADFVWLSERCKELEKRVADLDARPAPTYRGVWKETDTYPLGSIVTDRGSAWYAHAKLQGIRPGDGAGWQLMVKAGKDAR